jgi:hypothetical protein
MDRWSFWALSILLLATIAVVVASTRAPAPVTAIASSALVPPIALPSQGAEPSPARPPDDGPKVGPLPSSSAPRALPADAPQSVRIGVIQFSYRGAEQAPPGAPSRDVALDRARAALPSAREDFTKAVSLGDAASGADLGSGPRGVLESDLEYVVFSLAPGEVAPEPIDTPRGYWVVRRVR